MHLKKLESDNNCDLTGTEQHGFKTKRSTNTAGLVLYPQRILVDGINFLLNPISKLFKLIYEQKTIPEQWLVSKIIPI